MGRHSHYGCCFAVIRYMLREYSTLHVYCYHVTFLCHVVTDPTNMVTDNINILPTTA